MLMYVHGHDGGYGLTKTDTRVIFPSRILKDDNIIKDGTEVEYKGGRYAVGVGNGTVDINKIDSELTMLCLLTGICKSTNETDIRVATGLPISQFKAHKDELKDHIMLNSKNTIVIDGKPRVINIEDVVVFPEGAAALYAYGITGDALIVDCGSRTIDIALFNTTIGGGRELKRWSSLYMGTISLYTKVIDAINAKYDLSLKYDYGEKVFTQGLYLRGEKQDLGWLIPTYEQHVLEIMNSLKIEYPEYENTNVYLVGGGSLILGSTFKKYIINSYVLQNGQFANAIGFKRLGESYWTAKNAI